MKRIHVLFFVMLLLLPSFAFGEVDESQMMKGTKLSEPKLKLPTVVVGGNTIIGNIAQPGWPIVINAAMSVEDDGSVTEVPSDLQVKLIDQNGHKVPINFEHVQRENKSQRFWVASETVTQNLVAGQYTITFEPKSGLDIEPGELDVQSNPDNASSLGLLKIQLFLLMGKYDEAMAQADGLIVKDPGNLNAWIAKGDMLMAQDLSDEASTAYETAAELQAKTGQESLFLQERMSRAFFRSLAKKGILKNP